MVFAPKAIVYHTHPNTLMKYLRQKYRNAYWRVSVYAKRKKTFSKGHSYTPKSALIEVECAVVFLVVTALYLIFSIASYSIMAGGLLLFTFIPSASLTYYISEKDLVVGVFSPFIIMARAFATALGISLGLLRRAFR